MGNNLTCDICGYTHPRPDGWQVVKVCDDGVARCVKCRKAKKQKDKEEAKRWASIER